MSTIMLNTVNVTTSDTVTTKDIPLSSNGESATGSAVSDSIDANSVDTGMDVTEPVEGQVTDEQSSIDNMESSDGTDGDMGANIEGEAGADIGTGMDGEVGIGMDGEIGIDPGFMDGGMIGEGYMETSAPAVKDPLLSSWPFVIGISVAVLAVSIFLGGMLARRKIKKGIELYED